MPQVELDKENDYYMRPASPAHTYDPYAYDEHVGVADRSDTYHPESVRRIAPPPPGTPGTAENSDGSNILPCRKSTAPLHKRLAEAREGKRPSRDEKHRRR